MLNSQMIEKKRNSMRKRQANKARTKVLLQTSFYALSGFISFKCFDIISKSELSLVHGFSWINLFINLFPTVVISYCLYKLLKILDIVYTEED